MNPRPTPLPVSPDSIPAALKAIPAWVVWLYELANDKWTKVPYRVDGKTRASSVDPKTWGSFDRAIDRYQQGGIDGVGFVLSKSHGIVGVDLDHCGDQTRKIALWALKIIFELDSYTEFSPSETGIRIFLKATAPTGGCKKGNIEIYDSARYLTVTGCYRPGTPRTIEARQQALEALHHRVFQDPPRKADDDRSSRRRDFSNANANDSEILKNAFAAKNGLKVKSLYAGDKGNYLSQSEADLALCSALAFWTRDEGQLDRLFRASGLYREKWDARRYADGRTYGSATIARALGVG